MDESTLHVLLVEDNPGDARLLREALRDAQSLNSRLTHVQRLEQALQQLQSASFDVVLLDLSLPDSQGTDTVRQVIGVCPDLPVVVLTGADDEVLSTQAVRSGAQDYLVKGQTDHRLLRRAIRYAIERKRLDEQMRLQVAALEAAANGIAITNCNGTILWVNQAFCELTGYTRQEVIGKNPRIFKSGKQDEAFYKRLWDTISRGQVWHGELINRRKNGSEYVEEMTISPLRNELGAIMNFIAVKQDISGRKSEQDALAAAKVSAERAKAMAEEASQAKDNFLAALSHELRTPLTPVLTTASLLESDGQLPQNYREDVAVIRRNVELEARLIDDLLDVTRISRGKVELDLQPVALGEVIQRAVEVCMPDIEARGLQLGVDLGSESPYLVSADPARLQQVFWNLIRNAVKFTAHGGRVEVKVYKERQGDKETRGQGEKTTDEHRTLNTEDRTSNEGEAEAGPFVSASPPVVSNLERPVVSLVEPRPRVSASWVVTEVNDSGQGIDPSLLPRIFNPFEQGGAGVTRQFGGLGLGLTICKGLVEKHGGSIEAHSGGKGKGASFRVKLPLLWEARMREPTVPPAPPRATGQGPRSAALRVLLVEDHGDTAKILQRLLKMRGHEVELAGDVAGALELGGQRDFDLLISDLGLPDGSGVDVIRGLREGGRSVLAIALSGYGQEQDIQRTREAGFAAHLTKPVNLDRLAATIEAVAGRGRRRGRDGV